MGIKTPDISGGGTKLHLLLFPWKPSFLTNLEYMFLMLKRDFNLEKQYLSELKKKVENCLHVLDWA